MLSSAGEKQVAGHTGNYGEHIQRSQNTEVLPGALVGAEEHSQTQACPHAEPCYRRAEGEGAGEEQLRQNNRGAAVWNQPDQRGQQRLKNAAGKQETGNVRLSDEVYGIS